MRQSCFSTRCLGLVNMKPGYWGVDGPPIGSLIFRDGFESGDINSW